MNGIKSPTLAFLLLMPIHLQAECYSTIVETLGDFRSYKECSSSLKSPKYFLSQYISQTDYESHITFYINENPIVCKETEEGGFCLSSQSFIDTRFKSGDITLEVSAFEGINTPMSQGTKAVFDYSSDAVGEPHRNCRVSVWNNNFIKVEVNKTKPWLITECLLELEMWLSRRATSIR